MKTYSPLLDQYMTDANNQFVITTGTAPPDPEPVVPAGSILVSTRMNAAGIVALDLDGNNVGGFVPQGPYDVIDVQQITPGGDILLGQHPYSGGGDLVSRYDSAGNFVANISGTTTGKYAAHLAISEDGSNLAFAEHNMGGLSSIDTLTNQVVSSWIDDVAEDARGIDVGPDGFLYMAVMNSGIWKITPDFSSWNVIARDAQESYADITFGPDGKLYASTYENDGVVRYDVATGEAEEFIASDNGVVDLLASLMFHPVTGNLLVSSYRTDQILDFDGDTGAYIGEFAVIDQAWCISMAPGEDFTEPVPGDANGDGYVDVSDLGILATNYGAGGGFGWEDADFTGDGFVDVSDLGILATAYGTVPDAQSVPEPGAVGHDFIGRRVLRGNSASSTYEPRRTINFHPKE